MNELLLSKYLHFGKKINILAVYPNNYNLGIANLGHQFFYRALNETNLINCERLYLNNIFSNNLCSIETKKKIQNFDVIAFSICYELDIFNIINLLKKYNWLDSVLQKKYSNNRPLIIAGGALTFINPEIINKYTDYAVIGDFENIIAKFCEFITDALENIKRAEILKKYNFLFNEDNAGKWNTSAEIDAYSNIIPLDKNCEFDNTFLIELARGCPNNCSFCNTGATRNPLRFFDRQKINEILNILRLRNIQKLGLIGSAVLLYPNIKNFLNDLLKQNFQFSFSSLTINHLDFEIIELLVKSQQNTLTLAPEVGNEKMQKLINKKINIPKFLEILKFAVSNGIKRIKLYFLYGFEENDNDDIFAIIELVKEINEIIKIKGKPTNLIISLNPIIPKPNTPYHQSNKTMLPKKILERKKKILRNRLINLGCRLEFMSINEALLQYRIANNLI
ncbi:MAG TPA: radical SAM protein [bacterium]|nr:radical SAM protein [bacterium]